MSLTFADQNKNKSATTKTPTPAGRFLHTHHFNNNLAIDFRSPNPYVKKSFRDPFPHKVNFSNISIHAPRADPTRKVERLSQAVDSHPHLSATDAKKSPEESSEDEGTLIVDQAGAVPVPAPPVSPAAPAPPVSPAAPPTVTVTIPPDIRSISTPTSARNRIPPRVDTDVVVGVANWHAPLLPISLSISGSGGGNGTATINGGAKSDVTSNTTVKLKGVTQTDVGKAGNLRLVADWGGTRLASSNGFSVSAIPQNWTTAFSSLLTGPNRGFVVQDGWESDSGTFADLDKTEISESVEVTEATGTFTGVGGSVSGYNPGDSLTQDRHSTPVAVITGPGRRVAQQTCKFRDNRSASADIPLTNSGYRVIREVTISAPGSHNITTNKFGAATTANGISSAAGAGSVSRTQAV
jgi:hypothetical protein